MTPVLKAGLSRDICFVVRHDETPSRASGDFHGGVAVSTYVDPRVSSPDRGRWLKSGIGLRARTRRPLLPRDAEYQFHNVA